MSTEPSVDLKVLSVVGAGRSGTTVLASILGEVEGFSSAGELRWLWARGISQSRPCGCGRIPEHCPVWSQVIPAVRESRDPADPWTTQDVVTAQREVARDRNLLRLMRAVDHPSPDWLALGRVREATEAACRTFAAVTSARVVVDTSKRPQDAAVYGMLTGIEHYVLHIVRDPRAVVHSWRRAKSFTAEGGRRTMGTRRLPGAIWAWTSNGIGAELLRRHVPASRWMFLRYEDFVRAPRSTAEGIVRFVEEDGSPPFSSDDAVLLHPNHIVAGNPSRFTTGAVKIEADEEWRRAMCRRDQHLVSLATKPLRSRYGYVS